MSFSFQNADSIKQALFEELQNILSSETSIRVSAEGRMKQLEFTEGYGVYLSEFIMNQSFDLSLRQMACIMLTRYVENHWNESEERSVATEQAKKTIRNILPNGLYDPNSKIRSAVAHAISTIAATDWPTVWTDLFPIIIKCLGGNEDSIHGAMQVLQEFSYDENQIKELGPFIISEIYRIFESEHIYSVKTRTLAIKLLKPLFMSINCNIADRDQQAALMEPVLNNFIDKLLNAMAMNSVNDSNFMLKTEIVKMFTFLVTEVPMQPFMERILPPIWQLLTQVADIYVKVKVNQTEENPFQQSNDEELDELSNLSIMLIQIFEFIQCIVSSAKLRSNLKNVLPDLVYIVIVYLQVTVEQMESWNDDPERFVDDEDEAGVITIRLICQDVLFSLRDVLGPKMLAPLSEALCRHMNVAEAEKSSGNQNWWKINEACMVAVHACHDLIIETKDKFDLLNYLQLVRNLLNYDSSPHLVGRCLWTLSSYSQSPLCSEQMLEEALTVTVNSLARSQPIVLKISAARAIYGFVEGHEKTKGQKRLLIQSNLLGFVNGIIDLVAECKSSVLGLALETLTAILSFDQAFTASVHRKVIPVAIAVFLRCSEDPFTIELMQDMLKVLSQNPQCLQRLQEKFIPIIIETMNLPRVINQDIAIDILTTLVKYSSAPLNENLIYNAFPAMIHCVLHTDDHSVMLSGGECLRAYISVSAEQVCSYKNGEGLNYIMQVTTMLLDPMNNEMTAGQIGRLVITIISKVGNLLGENIDLLLKAVISKMQLVESLKVVMSLVVIFAHLFLTQMDSVLNFLSTVPGPNGEPALQFVFRNWLSKQNMFFGSYERIVSTLALCKLFEYGVTTQDNRITSITVEELMGSQQMEQCKITTRSQAKSTTQHWVTIPALVKMFKLLVNEMGYLRESSLADSETDENSSDDEEKNESGKRQQNNKLPRYVSDLYFNEDEDEDPDDDQLIQELMKDPLFNENIENTLCKFLQNFSTSEHFSMFARHLNLYEKNILKSIQIEIA